MKRVTLVRAATPGLQNPFSMRQPTNLLLLEIQLFPSMREGSVVAEEIPFEPTENVSSVDSDSAKTPQSDSVPKLCRKLQCHKECKSSAT